MPEYRTSDEIIGRARSVLRRERRRLAGLTDAPLVLTGGSSVPGALTVGDVDLHLRVDPSDFPMVVERLRGLYEVVHAEIWTDSLATFAVSGEQVGIAVTPRGSEHDARFTAAWERLRSEPELLEAYNGVKRAHAASDDSTYRAAKSAFFDRLADGDR